MKLSETTKSTIAGFNLGLILPLLAWVTEIHRSDLTLSVGTIIRIHHANVLLYILDTVPVVVAVVCGVLAKRLGTPVNHPLPAPGYYSNPERQTPWRYFSPRYLLLGFAMAVLMWVIDAVLDVHLFGATASVFTEILHPNKRELYFLLVIAISFVAFGGIAGAHKLRLDYVRHRILRREKQTALLLDSSGRAIYSVNLNRECTFANKSCWEQLGYESEAAILGKDMHAVIHHGPDEVAPNSIEKCAICQANLKGETAYVKNEKIWQRNGSSFPADSHCSSIQHDGVILGSIVSFNNIEKRLLVDKFSESNRVLNNDIIAVTTSFFQGNPASAVFSDILENILKLTDSEYGFIGDVRFDPSGAPYLTTKATTNIAWDQATRELYQPEGMEFRNLDTLFGCVMKTKAMVLSNCPATDERRGGLPEGHPPLTAFLGLPLIRGEDIIGMIGLANRPGGFDDAIVKFIEPFTNVCTNMIYGIQLREEKDKVEQRLRSFFDVSQEGIVFHDNGIITDANPKATELTGYGKTELIGRNVRDLVATEFNRVVQDTLASEESCSCEVQAVRKDGSTCYLELTRAKPETTSRGPFVVSLRDISEKKLFEQERERVAEDLVRLISTANAPIFGIDTKLRITDWNQAAEKITGFRKEDVIGHMFVHEFIDEADQDRADKILLDALSGKETSHAELCLRTRQGQVANVIFGMSTQINSLGDITGVVGIGQDLTELRQKENALNQAQKMEAVGQLTGGIAHDFNNLLSIIRGSLRFLQQAVPQGNKDIVELFEDATSAVDDGADLIQSLLGFSRDRVLQPKVMDVDHAIDKFSRFLTRTIGEGTELCVDVTGDALLIDVDPSQFDNALLNLCLNSRDALEEGGTISISAMRYQHGIGFEKENELDLANGNYIKISVTDTGSGISSNDLQHVYEPFFTTKEVAKGSGLGLSMVYGFVRQSDGDCHIESTFGEGTTASMYFPEAVGKIVSKEVDNEEKTVLRGSEVILVVEDEPRVRRMTIRDLRNHGYRVLEAENARVAVSIIESGEHIDLLFSDVVMPGEMNGRDLGVWARKYNPKIKVVLTSGYISPKANFSTDEDVLFEVVRKPYVVDHLARQIRGALME